MITAQQARDLTISKRKTIEDISQSITNCANAGMNYCCFKTQEVNVTPDMESQLKDMGYNVEIDDKFINITW